jgi:hypothetical protein
MAANVCRSTAFSFKQPQTFSLTLRSAAAYPYKTSHSVLAEDAADTTAGKTPLGIPGTAKMDTPWEELGFEFRPTKSNLRMTYKDGEWGEMELCEVSSLAGNFEIPFCVTHDRLPVLTLFSSPCYFGNVML